MAIPTGAREVSFVIPIVTPDDLLQFHLDHFGSTPTDSSLNASSYQEYQSKTETEDFNEVDLGYYPDGAQRTLTDEQIAIFRHSEIQRLLLKQYRDAEIAADKAEFGELSESQIELVGNPISNGDPMGKHTPKIPNKNKKQFAASSERTRNQTRLKQHQETEDWRVSTRRRVRELDEVLQQGDVVLDY